MIRKLNALHLIERSAVTAGELTLDPASPNYGRPEIWNLTRGLSGSRRAPATTERLHWTRAHPFVGVPIPWEISELRDNWGGYSKLQVLRAPLQRYRALWGYTEATFKHFTTTVVRIMGLAKLVVENQTDVVVKRIRLMQMCRSVLNAIPIDKEEEVEELAVSLAGAAEMLLRAQDDVGGAAGIPLTMLFGHSPAGFSSDDEPGMRNFYDLVADIQRVKLLPAIDRTLAILTAAREGPTKGAPLKRWQANFHPLVEPTDEEMSERRKRDAETAKTYVEMQALDPREVRESLRSDPQSPYQIAEDPKDAPASDPENEPAPGNTDNPGDLPVPTGGEQKVADKLVPGISVNNVKEIAIAIIQGEIPKDFGVQLAAVALALPLADAERLFASVDIDKDAIAKKEAQEQAKTEAMAQRNPPPPG